LRPAIPAHVDPEALLSVPQLAAAFDWLGQRALREAIKAERVRAHPKPGAQRWARFVRTREFAEDTALLKRCSAPGCALPAVADNGGCGQRGHGKAGRPRAPGDWSMLDKTAAAKAGKFSLARAARELGCDRTILREAIKRGDVHADQVGREFLIDHVELERIKRTFQCCSLDCEGVALGKTIWCGAHAGRASRTTPDDVVNKRISAANSAHRAAERARIDEKRAAERLLLIPEIAEERNRSVSLVRGHWVATGLLPAQNHWEGGTHVRLVERETYERFLRAYIFGAPSQRERYRRRRLRPGQLGRPRERRVPRGALRDGEAIGVRRRRAALWSRALPRCRGLLLAGGFPPLAGRSEREGVAKSEPRPTRGCRARG
jgi:hypothetical protein